MLLTKLMKRIETVGVIGNTEGIDIEGLCLDSKAVKKGDLFFCITGENKDGSKFAGEAVKKGAVAIVTEKKRG